jgi:phospholipase/carboxylesterase
MNLIHTVFEPEGDGPHPTIIAFHGWGASALDLIGLAPYVAGGRFLVLCPQGALEVPIGPTRGYGWYPISMGRPPDLDAINSSVEAVERFVDDALKRYPIECRKLALLGFSQGGTMAYNLAMRAPARYAGLVALSTWFPPELADGVADRDALMRLPTMVQHGRADNMIEIARARQSVETLRSLRVPLVYREYDGGHEITADGLEDLSRFLIEKVMSPIIAA